MYRCNYKGGAYLINTNYGIDGGYMIAFNYSDEGATKTLLKKIASNVFVMLGVGSGTSLLVIEFVDKTPFSRTVINDRVERLSCVVVY